ncbi:MAG: CapA family protein, partial [Cyanobacteriota bacterium]|nr:CapA family protein [Cyanobacteriota bacterium]
MSPQNLIKLAQQGDASAIATLINQALRSKKVRAKATRRDRTLYILLESEQLPNQSACIRVIQNGMLRLGTSAITLIAVKGQKSSQQSEHWTHTIALQTSVAPTKPPVPTTEKKPDLSSAKSIPAPSHSIPTSAPPPKKTAKPVTPKKVKKKQPPQAQPKSKRSPSPKRPLPQPVKQLLMAGSIGLMMAPLSGWFFSVQQDRISGFSRRASQALASIPGAVTSGLQNIERPAFPKLPEFSFSRDETASDLQLVSEARTL